MDSQIKGYKF